jgi:hypothetical protein
MAVYLILSLRFSLTVCEFCNSGPIVQYERRATIQTLPALVLRVIGISNQNLLETFEIYKRARR